MPQPACPVNRGNRRETFHMNDPETVCRQIYSETAQLYASLTPRLGAAALGFRVLYGPPIVEAPFLFVGYQPGGKVSTAELGHHDSWPSYCDYARADWHLAKRIRDVWGKARVERCTGLNAIFFRAPTATDWEKVDATTKAEVKQFSISAAERITRAVRPKSIVVIGLGTFDMLTEGSVVLQNGTRTLVRQGKLWGAPAYGVIHLSGAWVSRVDLEALKAFFSGSVPT